jgi:uncharacterized short protein YbdD (DUF466 family)
MGIEDIQISEELETNAPSIKYSGSEGPKSPQEEMMMVDAVLEEEYEKYVYDLLEQRPEATPMSLEEFKRMVIGDMSGGQPLPQDPTKPVNPFAPKPTGPVLPDRQMAAYGGIMGMDGRRQYGLGSSLKKFVRKIIPNEVAEIAVKAAPFVAPFNPLAAGLMSGIGSFDQTGRIGSSLKSGLMNYAMGQGARYLGGADFQKGINPLGGFSPGTTGAGKFSKYFSKPTGSGGIKNLFDKPTQKFTFDSSGMKSKDPNLFEAISFDEMPGETPININQAKVISKNPVSNLGSKIMEYVPTSLGEVNPFGQNFDIKKAVGAFGIYKTAQALLGGPEETVSEIMDRGEGLDIDGIRAEVREAFSDETGAKLKALRNKYPYLGRQDTKDIANMAMGGRIGFADAGAVLSEEQIAMMQNMIKKGMDNDTISTIANVSPEQVQNYIDSLRVNMENKAYGGRIGKAEGGIMDLGGMEKDYRAEGGFVPIGREEKADDVPARLSVNEFVFTADAVRNAGGGDIDRGAEVMENMMKHLEQGGQVSEESQGMQGAQQMFETSERLSEVI